MLIDWFTVCAQVLNFLVLVWLMKRFLYKPILSAIETRERKVADELAAADAKKADSQREHEEFQRKNEEFDLERSAMMAKASEEASAEGERLLAEARQAADDLAAKRQELLRTQAQNISQAVSRRARQEVFAITRKALSDLATTGLEEQIADVFIQRLRRMDANAKHALGTAIGAPGAFVIVKSAFVIEPPGRAAMQNALDEVFSKSIEVRFESSPDLILGIELSVNGQKVAWSINDYLNSLEKGIDDILIPKTEPTEREPEVVAGSK